MLYEKQLNTLKEWLLFQISIWGKKCAPVYWKICSNGFVDFSFLVINKFFFINENTRNKRKDFCIKHKIKSRLQQTGF